VLPLLYQTALDVFLVVFDNLHIFYYVRVSACLLSELGFCYYASEMPVT